MEKAATLIQTPEMHQSAVEGRHLLVECRCSEILIMNINWPIYCLGGPLYYVISGDMGQ